MIWDSGSGSYVASTTGRFTYTPALTRRLVLYLSLAQLTLDIPAFLSAFYSLTSFI